MEVYSWGKKTHTWTQMGIFHCYVGFPEGNCVTLQPDTFFRQSEPHILLKEESINILLPWVSIKHSLQNHSDVIIYKESSHSVFISGLVHICWLENLPLLLIKHYNSWHWEIMALPRFHCASHPCMDAASATLVQWSSVRHHAAES